MPAAALHAARGDSMKRSTMLACATCVVSAVVALAAPAPAPAAGPYDPSLDGWKQVETAATRAAEAHKQVLVIVGGNWCKWCRALDALTERDPGLHAELAGKFVVVHLNYSKDNKNPDAMEHLGHPEKLGFPSLLVVSSRLEVLKAQPSDIFETGDPAKPGHDPAKLLAFLERWEARSSRTRPFPKPDK